MRGRALWGRWGGGGAESDTEMKKGRIQGGSCLFCSQSHNPWLRDDIGLDVFELMREFRVTSNNKETFTAAHLGMEGIER